MRGTMDEGWRVVLTTAIVGAGAFMAIRFILGFHG